MKYLIKNPFDKSYITQIVSQYQSKRGQWPTNYRSSVNRANAQAFSEQEINDLKEWLKEREYETVELSEAEKLDRLGQPRLEGF